MKHFLISVLVLVCCIAPAAASGQAPVAVSDFYETSFNQTITVAADRGVLANDYDRERDTLTVQSYAAPPTDAGKITSFLSNGGFTFDPANTFQGAVTFTYRVSDGTSTSKPATVTIIVGERANRPPTAIADSYWTGINQVIDEAAPGLLRNDTDIDGDTISVSSFTTPANGTVNKLLTNGAFTYTPNTGFAGVDTFTYTISDGQAKSEAVTVTLYVGQTAGTDLLRNGGFENRHPTIPALPANWRGANLSKDRRVCNNPAKGVFFAHSGRCAFRFIGGAGEASGLIQNLTRAQADRLARGDILTLSAFFRDRPFILSGSATLSLTVFYRDTALGRQRINATIQAGLRYKYVQTSTLILKGAVRKVQVAVVYNGTSGGFLVDSISLAHNGTAVPRFVLAPVAGNPTTQADPVMPEITDDSHEWLPLPLDQ